MKTTSVALKAVTREMLEQYKQESGAKTLDEAMRNALLTIKKPGKSLFGAFKGIGAFKREEIDRFD